MPAVEIILSRAMNDAEFDELLFTDLHRAVAEYDLTAEEYARLRSLTRGGFSSPAPSSGDQRVGWKGRSSLHPSVGSVQTNQRNEV